MTLRVRLEVVPFGNEDMAYEIGRLDIFNKGLEPDGMAAYGVIEMDKDSGGLYPQEVRHLRRNGAWELVLKALNQLSIRGPK